MRFRHETELKTLIIIHDLCEANKKKSSEIISHLAECIIRWRVLLGTDRNPLLIPHGNEMKTNYDGKCHGDGNKYSDLWLLKTPAANSSSVAT